MDWDAALTEVIAVERAFAARATDTTVQQAFTEFLSGDATLFQPAPVLARDALRERPFPPDLRLEWGPAWADASAGGDLGYTTGPWRSGRRADPAFAGGAGWYATIWQRQPGGEWRAILDFGTSGPPFDRPAEVGTPAAPPGPAERADSTARLASLRLADEDLNHAIADPDSAALPAFLADDSRFLRDGANPLIGPSAAAMAWTAIERGARWVAAGAGASARGDLGYTFGTWSSPSDSVPRSGSWVRVWRRRSDGDWTLALDVVAGSR